MSEQLTLNVPIQPSPVGDQGDIDFANKYKSNVIPFIPFLTADEEAKYRSWQEKVRKRLPDVSGRVFMLRDKKVAIDPPHSLEYDLGRVIGIATSPKLPKSNLVAATNRQHVADLFDILRMTENTIGYTADTTNET